MNVQYCSDVNCADDFIRTYTYSYAHIRVYLYSYTCTSDVSLLFQDEIFSLCFIVVKKKEVPSLKKRRADNGKLTDCTKLIEIML